MTLSPKHEIILSLVVPLVGSALMVFDDASATGLTAPRAAAALSGLAGFVMLVHGVYRLP